MRLKVVKPVVCGNVELAAGVVLDSDDKSCPLPAKYLAKFAAAWVAAGICQDLEAPEPEPVV